MHARGQHAGRGGGRGRGGGGCGRGPGGRPGRGGLLEPALLAALAKGDAHGYALVEAVEDMTGGAVCADTGGVYRTLRRLEEIGCVTSDWVEGDSGPQRRRYSITGDGQDLLGSWIEHLEDRKDAISRLLKAAQDASKGSGESGDD
jgi:DNA-binding PadR family transcriptional regulator